MKKALLFVAAYLCIFTVWNETHRSDYPQAVANRDDSLYTSEMFMGQDPMEELDFQPMAAKRSSNIEQSQTTRAVTCYLCHDKSVCGHCEGDIMLIGLTAKANAAECPSADLQFWQDGDFQDGVYEGYYAQLDDLQKMIYNSIKDAFAEPAYNAAITFAEPILLEAKDGNAFTADDLYQWMCENMFNEHGGRYAVFRDHPELPWLLAVDYGAKPLGEWIYDTQDICRGYRMTGIYYENTYPWVPPEAYTEPDALEKAANGAVAAIGEARSCRAATARAILDYLCSLITYESITGTMPDKNGGDAHTVYYDATAYSVLAAPNRGVCNAYSAAFKLLCDRYGIPCVHVSGATKPGNHAWNYIQMEDGNWYAVDPTWSDGENVDYSYFLVGKKSVNLAGEAFEDTHEVPASNGGLPCPSLSDTTYPLLKR